MLRTLSLLLFAVPFSSQAALSCVVVFLDADTVKSLNRVAEIHDDINREKYDKIRNLGPNEVEKVNEFVKNLHGVLLFDVLRSSGRKEIDAPENLVGEEVVGLGSQGGIASQIYGARRGDRSIEILIDTKSGRIWTPLREVYGLWVIPTARSQMFQVSKPEVAVHSIKDATLVPKRERQLLFWLPVSRSHEWTPRRGGRISLIRRPLGQRGLDKGFTYQGQSRKGWVTKGSPGHNHRRSIHSRRSNPQGVLGGG